MKNETMKNVPGAWCIVPGARSLVLGVLCLVLGGGVASAETTMFKGQSITYSGSAMVSGDDTSARIITFTSGTGTLTLPGKGTADILVVGGGGGGGGGQTGSSCYGNGGNGGSVKVANGQAIPANTQLSITVGGEGTGGSTSSSTGSSGKQGSNSSFSGGSISIIATGGAGGSGRQSSTNAKDGTPATGTTSSISGTSTTYGIGGAKGKSQQSSWSATGGGNNTGNGGGGGGRYGGYNNYTAVAGAAGGSGVVIVKLTALELPETAVSVSAGGKISFNYTYSSGTYSTSYSVNPASGNGITASVVKGSQNTVATLTFTADPAAKGASQSFTLRAGSTDIAVFNVTVSDPLRLKTGASVNLGSTQSSAWTMIQSDASGVATVSSTQGGSYQSPTYTYTITAGNTPGVANCGAFHSAVGYFGHLVRVYDEHAQTVTLESEPETSVTVSNANGLLGDWVAHSANTGLATVALEGETTSTGSVTAKIKAEKYTGTQSAQTTVSVTNDDHVESITVVVSKKTKPTHTGDPLTLAIDADPTALDSPAAA